MRPTFLNSCPEKQNNNIPNKMKYTNKERGLSGKGAECSVRCDEIFNWKFPPDHWKYTF